jgi:hypothetical protein
LYFDRFDSDSVLYLFVVRVAPFIVALGGANVAPSCCADGAMRPAALQKHAARQQHNFS